jgi:indole-3-glycerol phosphate synthase
MKQTGTILDTITAARRESLARQKSRLPLAELKEQLDAQVPAKASGFYEALKQSGGPHIIAEAKHASPSAGTLREPYDLSVINAAYQQAPAIAAISVLTEPDHFGGGDEHLRYFAAHNSTGKPLLRKDFIFDPYQVLESKLLGAQAYLLIVSLLEPQELRELIELGRSVGLEPLVEAHTAEELQTAQAAGARCIGLNARNLHNFAVDTAAHRLLADLDSQYVRVAESGIHGPEDLRRVAEYADAVLIGSYFMKRPDIPEAINELTELAGAAV